MSVTFLRPLVTSSLTDIDYVRNEGCYIRRWVTHLSC